MKGVVIINPYSNWQERIYRLPKEWTDDELFMLIEQFIRNRSQYQTLQNYYIGRHDILNRTFDSVHKPNHKIVNNYPKLLVNTATSYFAGTPITFIPKCQDLPIREIHKVLRENNEVSVNGSLVKTSYKMGHAKEIHWCTKDGRHRFKHRSPQNLMVVYSNDLDEEMLAAVDVYENIDPMTSLVTYDITVYDKENIRKFRSTNNLGSGFEAYGSTIPHHFEEVPVIEVFNNEERMSIFEDVISLIDAQNLTISDSVNDIAEIGDSILKVTGMPETDEEL